MRVLKKIFILSFIFVFSFAQVCVFADDIDEDENKEDNIISSEEINETNNSISNSKLVDKPVNKINVPELNSRKVIVYDRLSGLKVYGKNENKETAMASTTKIMTAIIVIENCKNFDDVVTITSKAANIGGSRLKLNTGDKITVNDLLYGMLLRSGNDAAISLAIYTAGSVENFASLMNQKASSIGLLHTHFVTPHGLDDPNHYTTCYELAKITDYALNNDKFAQIVKTKSATITINGSPRQINNTNEILCSNVEGVYGVKTGFTNNAGRCLVTSIKKNDMDFIIIVIGADTRKLRASDTLKLIQYSFQTFHVENIDEKISTEFENWQNINQSRIFIRKASNPLQTKLGDYSIHKIATSSEVQVEINAIANFDAPLMENEKIGTLTVKNDNDVIEKVDILVANQVNKMSIPDYLNLFAKCIVY